VPFALWRLLGDGGSRLLMPWRLTMRPASLCDVAEAFAAWWSLT
jgi:hypothetical protein